MMRVVSRIEIQPRPVSEMADEAIERLNMDRSQWSVERARAVARRCEREAQALIDSAASADAGRSKAIDNIREAGCLREKARAIRALTDAPVSGGEVSP